MTYADVQQGVTAVLIESLRCEEKEIISNSRIIKDLGAESIDLVDIPFRLKRHFRLDFSILDLFPITAFDIDDTFDLVDSIQAQYPHLRIGNIALISAEALRDLYTVEAICYFIALKLNVPIPP